MFELLSTKLYIPPFRPELVPRPRLIKQLNGTLHRKLTLLSAPAGFGKTTLVSEWIADCKRMEPEVPVAWLSLDTNDNDIIGAFEMTPCTPAEMINRSSHFLFDVLNWPNPPKKQ